MFCLRRNPTCNEIPISADEIQCMREAEYHTSAPVASVPSAANTALYSQSGNTLTQLDPGSLNDWKKGNGKGKNVGQNSLLKQAIANRMVKPPEKNGEEDEMNKSILMHPSWYRDNDGRTGYKSKEWDEHPQKQKDLVKIVDREKKEERVEGGRDKEKMEEKKKKEVTEDMIAVEQTKEEAKALKKLEKEKEKDDKKRQKEEEKQMKKNEKEEKKKEKMEKKTTQLLDYLTDKASPTSSQKEKKELLPFTSGKPPKGDVKEKAGMSREGSNSSLTSTKTDSTVRNLSSPNISKKQDTREEGMIGSSPEEELGIQRKPVKTTIGERRDSSLSESSRVSMQSHKSVTFCDRIQITEIERHERETSSEEDMAIMSDDEMSKPDSARKRKLVRMLLRQQKDEESDDFEDLERKILEEQEEMKRKLVEQHQRPTLPMYNISREEETVSMGSYYPEETNPDRYLIEDDDTFITLENLPTSVRNAIIEDMNREGIRGPDETKYAFERGSMSKLHETVSRGSSILSYDQPILPRSASGYFEDNSRPLGKNMQESYQMAMQQQLLQTDKMRSDTKQKSMMTSFYDNVQERLPGCSSDLSGQSSSKMGNPSGVSTVADYQHTKSGQYRLDLSGGSRKQNSSATNSPTENARTSFFQSMTEANEPTERGVVNIPQKVLITSVGGTTVERVDFQSSNTEDDMRKKFVARFGSTRKAPMAEEDPADPRPSMGSSESVFSTDSRESVVSAASIRAETTVRRNFNY